MRAEEAIIPLLGLLRRVDDEQDDWVGEAVPRVLAVIGPASMPPLADYLANPAHGEWARVNAAKALGYVAEKHPEFRAKCVAHLTEQLEKVAEQSENLNAFLMSPLLDLKAVEAAPVMEKAFASGRVDESVNGDWEDAQIEFGLKTEREHPQKPNKLTEFRDHFWGALAKVEDKHPAEPIVPLDDFAPKPYIAPPKIGRNDPCPCGSGKKYKKCCGK